MCGLVLSSFDNNNNILINISSRKTSYLLFNRYGGIAPIKFDQLSNAPWTVRVFVLSSYTAESFRRLRPQLPPIAATTGGPRSFSCNNSDASIVRPLASA